MHFSPLGQAPFTQGFQVAWALLPKARDPSKAAPKRPAIRLRAWRRDRPPARAFVNSSNWFSTTFSFPGGVPSAVTPRTNTDRASARTGRTYAGSRLDRHHLLPRGCNG